MTGGELFLLDDGALATRLHKDARAVAWDPDALERAREVLRRHAEATGSEAAIALLEGDAIAKRMKRVVAAA